MNILVTGGAGFIGSHLVDSLVNRSKNNIIVVDNLITGNKKNISKKIKNFYKIDVNNFNSLKTVFNKHKFDYVFHFAALVGVKRTQKKPLEVLKDIEGFKNIFELSSKSNVKRIFFSSSSEVYGEPVIIPQNEETTPLNSKVPYAVVKNIGEIYCKTYLKEKKLSYTIFRFFNTYGKRQTNDFVISKFINLAKKNRDITIYGRGFQKRTFCYIDDNIQAITKCLEEDIYKNQIVNIGNNIEINMINLAKLIKQILNSSSKIIHLKALKEGDMSRRKPDITKMKKILLNKKFTSLNIGIKKLIS